VSTGFGTEIYCTDRLRTGKYVSGRIALAQAIFRRLTTPRGTLRGGAEEETYGIDLPGFVGRTATKIAVAALPGIVRNELLKDDRIADALVTVNAQTDTNGLATLYIDIDVVTVDEEEDFSLTIAASGTSVDLIGAPS
jgi:hypothetical protein